MDADTKGKAMSKKSKVKISIASIYSELGYINHEEMETKANLTMEISKTIKNKKLTQTKAAKKLGITQPKLSALLSGHFRGYSVERLMKFLTALGEDVDIVVRTNPNSRKARVKVYSSSHAHTSTPIAAKGHK
jgi:predicted XRE-type DNA-binding protein